MRYILLSLFFFSFSSADIIKTKTLACPSIVVLQKSMLVDVQDSLKLEMYAIANGCVILSRDDKVEALGYDPRNEKEIYQKILYKKTATQLFILRSAIQVEQGGKKNTLRF